MKKTLFVLIISIAFLALSCGEDKSKSLNYYDYSTIDMVLRGYHQLQVTSDYDVTYKAINPDPDPDAAIITVNSNGRIFGKNVGSAQVKISNGYESKTVDVNVSLFREPTFEFGCNSVRIRKLYGNPYQSQYIQDTILLYQYIDPSQGMYSAACYQMLFFFDVDGPNDIRYIESDVYILKDLEKPLLNNYLDDNFDSLFTVHNYYYDNEITHDSVDAIIYKSKYDENVRCGKFAHSNKYDDICLFYYYHEPDILIRDFDKSLNNLPRSSKFLY